MASLDDRPPDGFGIVVADLSFISTTVLPTRPPSPSMATSVLWSQFEPDARGRKGRGIIRDPNTWRRVLHEFIDAAFAAELEVVDLAISPVIGGKGNVEFLAHARRATILGDVTPAPADARLGEGS